MRTVTRICSLAVTAIMSMVVFVPRLPAAPRADGQLEIAVVDGDTGQPIAARMHLRNSRGRPVKLRWPGINQHADHFYIDGKVALGLRRGQFTFDLEAGPEFRTQSGHFEIDRHADDTKTIEMHRFANLAEEGWWAGDLDVARRPADLPLAMRAEALNVVANRIAPGEAASAAGHAAGEAAQATNTNANTVFGPFAQLHERLGGGLLLFNLPEPIASNDATVDRRSSLAVLREARQRGGRAVARTPSAWDLPLWLASGELDAIALIHHLALRDGVVGNEAAASRRTAQPGAGSRPRDRTLFPGATGDGRWSEAIYYHALGCGLRVPPAAGSGSGTNDNPLGTNRVYVYCGEEFSYERWWEGLEAGRVFVTNGPLLRPMVRGKPPGYVFHLDEGGRLSLQIALSLATRVPVEYLQVVKNGKTDVEVRLDEFAKSGGRLPPVEFDSSGWFLIRAVTINHRTYQLASSGPYYVEVAGRPRISRRSVQFFLDWLDAGEARLRELPDLDEPARDALLAEQAAARRYFEDLLAHANAD